MRDGNAAGPSIALRLIDAGDRALYHALYASPEVMRTIGPPRAGADIDAQFGRVLKHNRLATPGHRAWAISAAGSHEPFGLTALLRDGNRAEFGIMLLPHAWRRGIASAAVRALLPLAFHGLRLERLDASRADDAQGAVMHRLLSPFGFRRTAGLRPQEIGWSLEACRWPGAARG